jgi:hypothetical protein
MSACRPEMLRVPVVAVLALFLFQAASAGQYSPVSASVDNLSDDSIDDGLSPLLVSFSFDEARAGQAGENSLREYETTRTRPGARTLFQSDRLDSPANLNAHLAGAPDADRASQAPRLNSRSGTGVLDLRRQVLSNLRAEVVSGPSYLYTANSPGRQFPSAPTDEEAVAGKDAASDDPAEPPVFFARRPHWEVRKPREPDPTEDEPPDRTVSTFYFNLAGNVSGSLAGDRNASLALEDVSDYVVDYDDDPIEYRSVDGWSEDDRTPRTASPDGVGTPDSIPIEVQSHHRSRPGFFWGSRSPETTTVGAGGVGAETLPMGFFEKVLRWALHNPATAAVVVGVSSLFAAIVLAKNPAREPGPG